MTRSSLMSTQALVKFTVEDQDGDTDMESLARFGTRQSVRKRLTGFDKCLIRLHTFCLPPKPPLAV